MKYYANINNQKISLSTLEDYDTRAEIASVYGNQVIALPDGPPLLHINMIYAEASGFGFFSILAGLALGGFCFGLIGAGIGIALGFLIEYNVNRSEREIASRFNKTVFPTPLDTVSFSTVKFYVDFFHRLIKTYGVEGDQEIVDPTTGMKVSLPIRYFSFINPRYELVIQDFDNRYHYFIENGIYDGWSMATNTHLN